MGISHSILCGSLREPIVNHDNHVEPAGKVRIDKWLWAARFFKTRSMATGAINKNRVQVDGQSVKPSRQIQIGEMIVIEKPPYEFRIQVLTLSDKRSKASEAQKLYLETDQSIALRKKRQAEARADRMARLGLAGDGRPTKKQRRQIRSFKEQSNNAQTGDE